MQMFVPTLFLGYIDGGSASMFFQAILGTVLAVGYFGSSKLTMLWAKIRPVRKSDSRGQ